MENEKKNENNNEYKTFVIVKYILIFFASIALMGGVYYAYEIFLKKDSTQNTLEIPIDNEFNNLFKDREKDVNNNENDPTEFVENNCYAEDLIIKSGEKALLYSRKVVNPYERCLDFAQERICDDGFILGDNKFKFSSCRVDTDCQLPDNSLLENNKSIKLYSKKTVPFGETCERYASVRLCKNNELTGDERFIYKNCKISYNNSCDLGGGHILADNQTHVFYKKREVAFGQKCIDFSKRLICSDAVLQGGDPEEYKYWDCVQKTPSDCYIDGIKIDHGTQRELYSKKFGTNSRNCDFFKEERTCTDGKLDGQDEYRYANCYDN